eukprot:18082-Heterococcus_DN1.PRE.2
MRPTFSSVRASGNTSKGCSYLLPSCNTSRAPGSMLSGSARSRFRSRCSSPEGSGPNGDALLSRSTKWVSVDGKAPPTSTLRCLSTMIACCKPSLKCTASSPST